MCKSPELIPLTPQQRRLYQWILDHPGEKPVIKKPSPFDKYHHPLFPIYFDGGE